jgi:putative endonuclease
MRNGWWVYMVLCGDGSIYTGITIDPEARIAKHASGRGAKYTASHRPILAWAAFNLCTQERGVAQAEERRMKRLEPAVKHDVMAAWLIKAREGSRLHRGSERL